MIKKEILEAINILILHSDICEISIDDDRFNVKFSYYGKEDIVNPIPRIDVDFSQPTRKEEEKYAIPVKLDTLKDNLLESLSERVPIISETSDENWPAGKRPSSDMEMFKIALTRYITENPNKDQNEIGKVFGITGSTICVYIKKFCIPYNSKIGGRITYKERKREVVFKTGQKSNEIIAPQNAVIENNHQDIAKENDKETHGDMSNYLKKQLYEITRKAMLNIQLAKEDLNALKEGFTYFRVNGFKLTTSNLGTWALKSSNGNDSHLEFNGLAVSAQYQLFPHWEIGKSYCIFQFYGGTGSIEYILKETNGEIRVSRRP